MNENETEEKERDTMTREEAEAKLKKWGDLLEVDTDRGFFKEAIDELALPVMKGRLDFDPDTEEFTYRLIKSLKRAKGDKELIKITEGNFGHNKVLDRFKENDRAAASAALFARHTGLIAAEVDELSTRDISRINAVFVGFFVQTKSSR
ncbi:MAG: hypothetical protein IMZ69_06930 [Spirochaetes bacterium]|nr:hypothetical protein [Spirochaetota bacterium]